MRVRGKCSRPNCDRRIDRRQLCRPHYDSSGQAQGYVDTTPAKERLRLLRERGLTLEMLEAQGITRSVVARVDRGRQRIHRLTEERIFNVPIPLKVVPSGAGVPVLGMRRRLQALAAIGWPQTLLAEQMGLTQSMLANRLARTHVTAKTARAAAELFTKLQSTPGPSVIAASRARAKGWEPPFAWDTESIDDPDAELVQASVSWLDRYMELQEIGVPESRIPERMGVDRASVDRQLMRLGISKGAA